MENIPILDGHNDTLLNLSLKGRGRGRSFFERSKFGHVDLPRAKEGNFAGGFFACFAPPDPKGGWTEEDALVLHEGGYVVTDSPALPPDYALLSAERLTGKLFELEEESEGRLKVVRSVGEIEDCLQNGTIAAILHFEGAENLGENADSLEEFHEKGLRSLGLVWSRPNRYANGVPFRFPASPDTGAGLTGAGRELVKECNRLGVLVDLSHINERGFWEVSELSDAPLVATHSNAHAICPSTRNLTDKQLDAIRDSDGMVGVNFAVGFLREDGANSRDTTLDVIADHVDHIVERLGIERVGFGSDFDGALTPRELSDASNLPKLVDKLRERGYGDEELQKLAHENWLRVLGKTWK